MEPQERSHPPLAADTDLATALRFVTAIAALVRRPAPACQDLDRRTPLKPAFDDGDSRRGDAS
jgi:hypothetical protein